MAAMVAFRYIVRSSLLRSPVLPHRSFLSTLNFSLFVSERIHLVARLSEVSVVARALPRPIVARPPVAAVDVAEVPGFTLLVGPASLLGVAVELVGSGARVVTAGAVPKALGWGGGEGRGGGGGWGAIESNKLVLSVHGCRSMVVLLRPRSHLQSFPNHSGS